MDTTGGAAALTTLKSQDDKISTIDMRVDYLLPGSDKDLIIEGEVVRSGNRVIATKMKVYHDNEEEIIAEGRAVFSVRRES